MPATAEVYPAPFAMAGEVNALLSILLADIAGGTVGFFVSTAVIVVFGEIVPQATCN